MSRDKEIDTLFTEHNPRAYGYAKHADDEFEYMNLHADAPVLAAREILEGWYRHYPDAHRLDLVHRFRSKNHKRHDGAFWELYLHELFRRMGYSVQVHPPLDGVETQPDFLLTKDGVGFAFVEARLAGLETDQITSAERLKKELYDALDKVHSPNFFLFIEEIRTAPMRPTFRYLTKLVERWLETLDPDLPMERFFGGNNATTCFQWEHQGWYVSLKVIPKSADHRGRRGGRSVGIIEGGDFQWVNTKGKLRRALDKKARKYGEFDLPFLIAANYMGVHCDRKDWVDALYGSQAVNVGFDEREVHHQQAFRKRDGFWIRNGTPLHTNISAILAASNINTWSMGAQPIEVYQHFSADYPIDLGGNLPCWCMSSGEDELVMRPGRPSAEILEIPEGWPGKWNQDGEQRNPLYDSEIPKIE